MDTHWQDCHRKVNSKKFYWNLDAKKYRIGNVFLLIENKKLVLSVHVDDIKMAAKKQNVAPMWKNLIKKKNADLDEPASFLDHVCLGCTQRACKPNEIVEEYTKMFESCISAETTEKLPGWENLTQRRLHGPTTWKDMLGNALRDTANWQTKKWSNYTKFQVFA